MLCLYGNIDVHIVVSVSKISVIFNCFRLWSNQIISQYQWTITTYWRIKSFIHELLHWGTFRRAKAAACISNKDRLNTAQKRGYKLHQKNSTHTQSSQNVGGQQQIKPRNYLDYKIIDRYFLSTRGILQRIQFTSQSGLEWNKKLISVVPPMKIVL